MINHETLISLSLAEKISAMETLWNSLCRDEKADVSPAWHEAVLQQRKSEILEGKHRDWVDAKKHIRQSIEH